jgi:hypothetical protein
MFRGTGKDMKNVFKLGIVSVFLASNAYAVDFTVSLTDVENTRLQSAKTIVENQSNVTFTDQQFIREIIRQYTVRQLVNDQQRTSLDSAQSASTTFRQSLNNDFPDETLDCSVQDAGFCFRGSCDAGSLCEDVNGSCQCVSTPTTTIPAP